MMRISHDSDGDSLTNCQLLRSWHVLQLFRQLHSDSHIRYTRRNDRTQCILDSYCSCIYTTYYAYSFAWTLYCFLRVCVCCVFLGSLLHRLNAVHRQLVILQKSAYAQQTLFVALLADHWRNHVGHHRRDGIEFHHIIAHFPFVTCNRWFVGKGMHGQFI